MKFKSLLNKIFKIKESLKVNDFVIWENRGTLQWSNSRRIVFIQDGYAFFDGSLTGIPLKELKKETKIK